MKKIFLLFSFVAILVSANAQKDQHLINYAGIGELTMEMSKAEIEKLLKIKIVLKHIGVDEVYTETIKTKYLGMDVELSLFRSDDKVAILDGVTCSSPLFKTA